MTIRRKPIKDTDHIARLDALYRGACKAESVEPWFRLTFMEHTRAKDWPKDLYAVVDVVGLDNGCRQDIAQIRWTGNGGRGRTWSVFIAG